MCPHDYSGLNSAPSPPPKKDITMKPIRSAAVALLLLLLTLTAHAQSTSLRGKVVAVTDGDTLTILDASGQQHKIRLMGIDAPERGQPFGEEAAKFLAMLAQGKTVNADCPKKDRYGRLVCKVYTEAATDLGQALLWGGMAWHYKFYQNEQTETDRRQYSAAEDFARGAKSGLWADAASVAPWDFRRSEKREVEEVAEPGNGKAGAAVVAGAILGNRRSGIYHWPGCPNYSDISADNRVAFTSREEAERAGYRAARNCKESAAEAPAPAVAPTPSSSGGTVQVKGYYRKDGTYVRPHTRRAPRRKN